MNLSGSAPCSAGLEFFPVGAPACCARPCNARENVGYLSPRNVIPHSPRPTGLVNAHQVNKANSSHRYRKQVFQEAAFAFMRGRSASESLLSGATLTGRSIFNARICVPYPCSLYQRGYQIPRRCPIERPHRNKIEDCDKDAVEAKDSQHRIES